MFTVMRQGRFSRAPASPPSSCTTPASPPPLQCDNMASILMKSGKIDIIFVGCDRVARNGDAANKIGTSGVAILAKHHGIPFYVCADPTIDMDTLTGDQIPH